MFTKIKHFMRERVFSHIPLSVSISGDSLMYGIISLLVIIGPLFFIPVRAFSVSSSKGFMILGLGLLALLVYCVYVLKNGMITFPKDKLFKILGLIVLVNTVGTFIAGTQARAFLGYGLETTSIVFVVLFSLILFFASLVMTSYKRVGMLYGGVLIVTLILGIIHVLRYVFGPAFASMGVLGGTTASLMGSWGDLAMLFGLGVLFCVVTMELAGLRRIGKWIVGSMGALFLVFLLAMNIRTVWLVLGFVALLLTLYLFSFAYWDTEVHSYKKVERVPWYMLGLFLISVLAIFFGGLFHNIISRHQDISWSDMRPSWQTTAWVAGKSLVHNPATGYGPNTFSEIWLLVKPPVLSTVEPSRSEFSQGVGYVPTQLATTGILGAVLWVLFFGAILHLLVQKTRVGFRNSLERYFSITLGVGIVYLGTLAWVYIPGNYLLILFAVLIGAFIALFDIHPETNAHTYSFIKDPRTSFFGILGVTIIIVGVLIVGYKGIRNVLSMVYYTQGMVLLNQNKLPEAASRVALAGNYAGYDVYYRQMAVFAASDAVKIASSSSGSKETLSRQAEQRLGTALAYAQEALKANKMNYRNWITLGDVYQSMVGLGITDASSRAMDAYKEAQTRNPHDARIPLSFARLALTNKKTTEALESIKESLKIYPTFDAYLLQAQIFMDQRNYQEAILSLQQVLGFEKTYALGYIYLGYAYEQVGDTVSAEKIYAFIRQQFPGGAEAITAFKNRQPQVVPDPVLVAPAPKK